jgi:hypothetical protein
MPPRPTLVRIDVWDLRRLFNEGRFIQKLRAGQLSAASVWVSVVKPDNPRIGPPFHLEVYPKDFNYMMQIVDWRLNTSVLSSLTAQSGVLDLMTRKL